MAYGEADDTLVVSFVKFGLDLAPIRLVQNLHQVLDIGAAAEKGRIGLKLLVEPAQLGAAVRLMGKGGFIVHIAAQVEAHHQSVETACPVEVPLTKQHGMFPFHDSISNENLAHGRPPVQALKLECASSQGYG